MILTVKKNNSNAGKANLAKYGREFYSRIGTISSRKRMKLARNMAILRDKNAGIPYPVIAQKYDTTRTNVARIVYYWGKKTLDNLPIDNTS